MNQLFHHLNEYHQKSVICYAFFAVVVIIAGFTGLPGYGETPVGHDSGVLPAPVTTANFTALKENSPFLRSVGLSKSLVLTGAAKIGDDIFITLIDLESGESYIVSQEVNAEGWQLVEVKGDQTDLKSLTAQIKVAGSEVVSIRYEKIPAKITKQNHRKQNHRRINAAPHAIIQNRVKRDQVMRNYMTRMKEKREQSLKTD